MIDGLNETPYGTEIIGPFESYRAVVGGYRVPHVELHPVRGSETKWNVSVGGVCICADHEEVCKWLPFVAHAMARAAGYSTHGENSMVRNDYSVQVMQITGNEVEE